MSEDVVTKEEKKAMSAGHTGDSRKTKDTRRLCREASRLIFAEPPRLRAALPLLEAASKLGEPWAAYTLATMLETGDGVRRDVKRAAVLYRQAASRESGAAVNLGILYGHGVGVERDEKAAVRLFRKAARLGNPKGMYNLALYYDRGRGVKQSDRRAFRWYLSAAMLGDPDAQRIVGYLFHEGIGTTKDSIKAVYWYRKAARQGDAVALYDLGLCYLHGDGIRRSRETAIHTLRASAQRGHKGAVKLLRKVEHSTVRQKRSSRREPAESARPSATRAVSSRRRFALKSNR